MDWMLSEPPHPTNNGRLRPRPAMRTVAGGRGRPAAVEPVVALLDEDPELADALTAEERAGARRAAIARLVDLDVGAWPRAALGRSGMYGFLILDGVVGIRTETARQSYLELLGAGDLVRPWLQLPTEATPIKAAQAVVLAHTRVAVLDGGFGARIARWPGLASALMDRLVLRARRLSYQLAVFSLPRVEDRLELMLWHFAERWGRVTPSGVVVDLPLTHSQLAEVIGVRRPSVTTALGALESREVIRRSSPHRVVLLGDPPTVGEPDLAGVAES